MKDYASNLSQSERLELSARTTIIPRDAIGEDERRVSNLSPKQRRIRAVCGLNGFHMPCMDKVREHDARMQAFGSSVNVHNEGAEDEEQDEESEGEESEDEETALRDAAYAKRSDGMREHSFRLPSQRSRRDVSDTLASMGMSYHE